MCNHPCNSELKPDTCMYLGDDIHPCNQASYIQISPQGRATVYHVPRTHMYLHRYMHAWMHGPAIVNNKNKNLCNVGPVYGLRTWLRYHMHASHLVHLTSLTYTLLFWRSNE